MKFPDDEKAMCMREDVLIPSVNELICDFLQKDQLERCLTRSLSIMELENKQVYSILEVAESIIALKENEKAIIWEEEKKTPYGLVLKELPKHLRYAFLGKDGTKLVIIYASLSEDIEHT